MQSPVILCPFIRKAKERYFYSSVLFAIFLLVSITFFHINVLFSSNDFDRNS